MSTGLIPGDNPERKLALSYARPPDRIGLTALFALDARLGEIVRATRQPLAGQMRLAWWREAVVGLDTGTAPAEPVLAALSREVLPKGVRGADLAAIAEGWEALLADPLDSAAMAAFATRRGGVLFEQAALVLGGGHRGVTDAGEGWALADLAAHLHDPVAAERARGLARERFSRAPFGYWPRRLRPLGALALLAQSDLAGGVPGSPGRVVRLLAHRLTGR